MCRLTASYRNSLEKEDTNVFLYYPDNLFWSHQVLRLISESYYGGGDFGEIHRVASRIKVNDEEDWYRSWNEMGTHVENLAKKALELRHITSARKAFFRAFNYFRMAEFFLREDDQRKNDTYLRSVDCFRKAARLTEPALQEVEVPFGSIEMHAYFIPSFKPDSKSPALVWFGGADGIAEELYFLGAQEAVERGISSLIVDGPGQGATIRLKHMRSIPDYERAYSAAFDYLEKREEVDPQRIAIVGRSMGGYYGGRAAACEKRANAAVIYDACYSVLEDIYDYFAPIRPIIEWTTGLGKEKAREGLKAFTMEGFADRITCPLLIVHGEEDYVISPRAAHRLYKEARGPKELKMWKAGHGIRAYYAEALSYVFDWLANQMRIEKC